MTIPYLIAFLFAFGVFLSISYIFNPLFCFIGAIPKPFLHSFAFCLNHWLGSSRRGAVALECIACIRFLCRAVDDFVGRQALRRSAQYPPFHRGRPGFAGNRLSFLIQAGDTTDALRFGVQLSFLARFFVKKRYKNRPRLVAMSNLSIFALFLSKV